MTLVPLMLLLPLVLFLYAFSKQQAVLGRAKENILSLKVVKYLVNADPGAVVEVGQERQVFLQEGHSQQSLLVLELVVRDCVRCHGLGALMEVDAVEGRLRQDDS